MLLCTQEPEHISNGNVSGSNFPRGNNNQGGNGHGGNHQGKPGNQPSGNQGNQNNHPKQGKRPADGDSKPSKKQKMNNDNEKKWAQSMHEIDGSR